MLNNERFAALLADTAKIISYICDFETRELLYMSSSAMKAFGLTSEEQYKGKKCHQLIHNSETPCAFCTSCRLTEGEPYRWEHFNANVNRWFDITDTLASMDGKKYKISTALDITARREVHSALPENVSTEDVLFRCLHVLSTEKDLHRAINLLLSYVGEYYQADRAHIFEIDRAQNTFNSTFEWYRGGEDWNSAALKDIPLPAAEKLIHQMQGGGTFSLEPVSIELDGIPDPRRTIKFSKRHQLLVTPLVRDGELVGIFGISDAKRNSGYVSLLRSVSEFILAELEKRRLLEDLERLSYIDILTETDNRNSYTRLISEYLVNPPACLGIISITLNGLKHINDTYGQTYGDSLIVKTARRIRDNIKGTIFRIGGDEFVVFTPGLEHTPFVQMVEDLIASFREENEFSVSIGYDWDSGDIDLNEQIHRAQVWMRARKQHFYQSEFVKGRSTGNSAEDLLREIEEDRFDVWFQPQVNLHTGEIIGAEALVRKRGDNGTFIPPAQFIPYYEARNVIPHLDMHVLDRTLGAIRTLQDRGLDLSVSVNFSRSTLLVPNFNERFYHMCQHHGVSPNNITVEVTETIAALGRETLQDLLAYMHASGLRLSLDDFGSKYSNLAILTNIAFDEIKFDKTLVDDICNNARSQIILKNLIQMCRTLQHDTHIVVEGIELPEQAELLKDYCCDCAQGYYFHRPMPLDQFIELLENPGQQIGTTDGSKGGA